MWINQLNTIIIFLHLNHYQWNDKFAGNFSSSTNLQFKTGNKNKKSIFKAQSLILILLEFGARQWFDISIAAVWKMHKKSKSILSSSVQSNKESSH